MELRQLKYFTRSAETLNFTQAAKECFISQSTLSQQIRQLESELDAPLFDRIGKHVVLTEVGRNFLPYAIKALNDAQTGKQIARDLLDIRKGELTIGITFGLSAVFSQAMTEFNTLYPNVKVNAKFGTSVQLNKDLRAGKISFALSFTPPGSHMGVESVLLFRSPLVLVCHPDHSISGLKKLTLRQLNSISLVLPSIEFHTRQVTEGIFLKYQLHPFVHLELNDIHVLLNLILLNSGWCTILTRTTTELYPQLTAVPLPVKDIAQEACISWLEGVYRQKSALEFCKIVSRNCSKT